MVWEITTSEKKRLKMLRVTLGLGIVSLFLNKIAIVLLVNLNTTKIKDIEPILKIMDLHNYPFFCGVTSCAGIVINLVVIHLVFSSTYPGRRSRNINAIVIVQYLYLFYIAANGAIILVSVYTLHNVEFIFEGGLFTSLKKYGSDPETKRRIDNLQMKFQCCGDKSFTDWFNIQWIRHPYINMDDAIERNELRSDGRYRTDSVPFSCCNPATPRPCIFDHVKDHGIHINYNYEKDHTLYPDGCRIAIVWKIRNSMMWMIGLEAPLVLINFALMIVFRYISTSILEALKQGRPNATTMAYL